MAPKILRVTSGADWRAPRRAGIPIELPSGNVALVRPVEPQRLLAQGELLDILTPLVAKMLFAGADASLESIAKVLGDAASAGSATGPDSELVELQAAAQQVGDLERVCDIVCKAAFVSPRVVDDPQGDDEIAPDDIELADKVHVLTLALRGAAALRHFRYEPNGHVEPVSDGQGDTQPTV